MPAHSRIVASKIPNGNHKIMVHVASGVGRKASLPSWNTNGFGYLSLGICVLELVFMSSFLIT